MIDGTRAFLKLARPAGGLINRLLAPAGLRVTRAAPAPAPCDLRTVIGDPIEGAYHSPDTPFVIDAALHSCRALNRASEGIMAFACTVEAKHPFVETLLAYRRGECRTYGDSPLRAFYEAWQPANAAEALGLHPEQAHPALRNAPAIGAVLPWVAKDPNTWMALRISWNESDYREHGADLAYEHGAVSEARGELEFNRLTRAYESIRRNGYQRSDHARGDIGGHVLCSNSISRILVADGQHRIAALAALGYDHAPIRFRPPMIHRADVASWPNVRSGLFTQEQALALFDRVFDGRQPAGYNSTMICYRGPRRFPFKTH